MVVEAGVVAGYVIAWVVCKARRVAGRADAEVDAVVDASLDKLHELVTAKLGTHPVLNDLAEEADAANGQVSELTRQQVELAVMAAARKDDAFGREVTELVTRLRTAEQASGISVVAGSGSAVSIGDMRVEARDNGLAIGQVGGDLNIGRAGDGQRPDPSTPGRPRP